MIAPDEDSVELGRGLLLPPIRAPPAHTCVVALAKGRAAFGTVANPDVARRLKGQVEKAGLAVNLRRLAVVIFLRKALECEALETCAVVEERCRR